MGRRRFSGACPSSSGSAWSPKASARGSPSRCGLAAERLAAGRPPARLKTAVTGVSAADQERPPNRSTAGSPPSQDAAERSRSLLAREGELLGAPQCSLLIDRYELTMAASYLARGRNEEAVFELFIRSLPPQRAFLLFAGLQPALGLLLSLSFGEPELAYLRSLGYPEALLNHLAGWRFRGSVEAVPEGTVVFAGEPLLRVTAPRIDGQLLETVLLNQIVFQTAVASKAARVVLAAGGGAAGRGEAVVDFSPRRDHGVDAALKVARAAGIPAVGTMAHSYVLSFPSELEAFCAFLEDNPREAVLLVDTYDPLQGVRNAIEASRRTGVPLHGIRIDSGDLLALSREARRLLDEAGLQATRIVASGDLEERQIARLLAAGAPIDSFGVGTELGVSRDVPVLPGVYKLVAQRRGEGWQAVAKRSVDKETVGGVKEVVRVERDGAFVEDLVVGAAERERALGVAGRGERRRPLLRPYIKDGKPLYAEGLEEIRRRARRELERVPPLPTLGPLGSAERLNWLSLKNRSRKTASHRLISALEKARRRWGGISGGQEPARSSDQASSARKATFEGR